MSNTRFVWKWGTNTKCKGFSSACPWFQTIFWWILMVWTLCFFWARPPALRPGSEEGCSIDRWNYQRVNCKLNSVGQEEIVFHVVLFCEGGRDGQSFDHVKIVKLGLIGGWQLASIWMEATEPVILDGVQNRRGLLLGANLGEPWKHGGLLSCSSSVRGFIWIKTISTPTIPYHLVYTTYLFLTVPYYPYHPKPSMLYIPLQHFC